MVSFSRCPHLHDTGSFLVTEIIYFPHVEPCPYVQLFSLLFFWQFVPNYVDLHPMDRVCGFISICDFTGCPILVGSRKYKIPLLFPLLFLAIISGAPPGLFCFFFFFLPVVAGVNSRRFLFCAKKQALGFGESIFEFSSFPLRPRPKFHFWIWL